MRERSKNSFSPSLLNILKLHVYLEKRKDGKAYTHTYFFFISKGISFFFVPPARVGNPLMAPMAIS